MAEIYGAQLQDRFAYWSETKAFLDGVNPYDTKAVLSNISEYDLSFGPKILELVWGLPFIFITTFWFGFFSFSNFLIVHLIFSTLLFIISINLLTKIYIKDDKSYFFVFIFSFTFFPFFIATILCPVTCIYFSAFSYFVYLTNRHGLLNSYLAGTMLTLTAIKPHIIYLLYLVIFLLSIRDRQYKTLLGAISSALILLMLAIAIHPNILSEYLSVLSTFPITYVTPTLSSILINYFDFNMSFRFLALFLAILLMSYMIFIKKIKFDNMLIALTVCVSIVSAPYLWTYDFSYLFFPAILLLGCQKGMNIYNQYSLLMANLFIWIKPAPAFYTVWYPIFVLILVIIAIKQKKYLPNN
jgi:hypothetical protein